MAEKSRTVEELLNYINENYGNKRKEFKINDRSFNGIGDTALHYYSGWADAEAVQILLANGADVNAKSEDGMTPIYGAIRTYQPHIVHILIEAGADLKHKDDLFSHTPLQSAELQMLGVKTKEKENLEKIIELLKRNQK